MRRSLYQLLAKKQREIAQSENWFQCVSATVAVNDDPHHLHRIKVIIPIIDEQTVHDEWVKQMGGFAGSGGYGNFEIPKLGSEVVLFSEFGQGENLYYQCVYNETNPVPGDFEDETSRGVRSDGDLKFICRGDLVIEGGRILMKSAFGTIQISAAAGIIFAPEDEG
jgi:Type VI secretion system/phage-baseplate injector OB domain